VTVCVLLRNTPGGIGRVETRVKPSFARRVLQRSNLQAVRTAPARVRDACLKCWRERQTGLSGEDDVRLPAAEHRVRKRILDVVALAPSERQFVVHAVRQAMPDIEAAVPPVEIPIADVLREGSVSRAAERVRDVVNGM